jgi:hypothetical protein
MATEDSPRPRPQPRPSDQVVITKHADFRLHERAPELDLDAVRTEVTEALLSRRFRHQGKRYWLAWTPGMGRVYAIARGREARVVVLTVLTPRVERAAA